MAGKIFQLIGTVEEQPDGTMRVLGVISANDLPSIPQNLRVLEDSETFVSLVWDGGGGAVSWIVYRDDIEHDTTSLPEYTDTISIVPATTYEYRVKAVNNSGQSGLSDPVEAFTEVLGEPSPPTGLVADEVTATVIELRWSPQSDATSWNVYRDVGLLANVTIPEYNDTDVEPATSYTYRVSAINSEGESAQSDAAVVLTENNSAPVWNFPDQVGVENQAFSIILTTVAADQDGHPMTFSVVSGSVPGLALTGNAYGGVFTTAGTHAITFDADDGYTNTEATVTFTVSAVADTTAPSIPQNLVATVNGSTVTLTWSASTDAGSGLWRYRVRRAGSLIGTVDAGTETFQQTGLSNGTYTYTVRAEDFALNLSNDSNIATAVVNVVPSTPDTPANFLAVGASSSAISLSWQAGAAGATPTKYQVDFSTSSGGPWTNIVDSLVTSFTHAGRTISTQYFYRVRAHAGALTSGYATANATTTGSALIISQGSDNPPWPHGGGSMGVGNSPGNIAQWETWMGHTMEIYTEWFGQGTARSWSEIENYNAPKVRDAINFFVGSRLTMPIVVRTPLLPNDGGTDSNKQQGSGPVNPNPATWDRAAAGNYTSHWAPCAETLRDLCNAKGRNPNSIIWSLGWEMTGSWYPWAIGTKPTQYKTYFGLVVDEIRSVIPGARIDWPPARQRGIGNPTLASLMPAVSKIDFISRSLHDGNPFVTDEASWLPQLNGSTANIGLVEVSNLARANGKKICLSEWASQIDDSGDSHGPSLNAALFYQRAWDTWLYPNRDIVAYDTLFQPSDCQLYKRTTHPAAVAFKGRWRQPL